MQLSYLELYIYLRGFNTPRLKRDLISLAKQNGATPFAITLLEGLSDGIYVNLRDVIQEVRLHQQEVQRKRAYFIRERELSIM
jgi:hypothetical protein